MDQNKICEFLVKLRKEKKLSQDDVAGKVNISRQAISKWEQGICLPDRYNLEKLSKIYEVSIGELFAGERLSRKEDENEVILNLHETSQKKNGEQETTYHNNYVCYTYGYISFFNLLLYYQF